MKISGIGDRTLAELEADIYAGGRFVIYTWAVSVVVMTFKRPSEIYYIPSGKSRLVAGLKYSLISLVFGWWGIPWGPIYTIGAFVCNFGGGKDITQQLLAAMQEAALGDGPGSPAEHGLVAM
ncbi:hypothetical protein [Flaviaesturariibacter terrae]